MKTYTIELPQPSGRVVVYSGVRLIGRQRERKVRRKGHWTQKIAPGLYAWYKSPWAVGSSPGSGFFGKIDDTNLAQLSFAPEREIVLPKDMAQGLAELARSFEDGAGAAREFARVCRVVKKGVA